MSARKIFSHYHFEAPLVRKQRAFTKIDLFKTRFFLKLAVLVGFIVLLCLFYVWSRVQVVQMSYEINRHKQMQNELVEENKRLRMEIAAIQSPQSLVNIATGKLKMGLPQKKDLVHVQPSSPALVSLDKN